MKRALLAIIMAMAVTVAFAPYTFAQKAPAATMTLTPKTMGPVTFTHAAHAKLTKCDTCHDPKAPGKLRPVAGQPSPFHAPMAKSGLCVDCHNKEKASNAKVPTKCTDCHQKKG